MTAYRGGGPAFPMKEEQRKKISENFEEVIPGDWPGMELRDYFAIRVLNEIISQIGCWSGDSAEPNRRQQAQIAYQYADSMLAARTQALPEPKDDITPTLEAHPVNF